MDWNEINLSEDPAIEWLQAMGYTYVSAEDLDTERTSQSQVLLLPRLDAALRQLNPWISDDNVKKAERYFDQAASLGGKEGQQKIYIALTRGISLPQNLGRGKQNHTVRFIDFLNMDNNSFLVTRQLRVVRRGKKLNEFIIPDIVVFVNGIPLVVIECKSPLIHEPINQAIEHLARYQELDDVWNNLGAPNLFDTVQFCIALCGQAAKVGPVGALPQHWGEWKDAYPANLQDLTKRVLNLPGFQEQRISLPRPQEVALQGLLEPNNLLDLVRNFMVFEVVEGRTVFKMARYPQFLAVNKAIERVGNGKMAEERGGVVWHTQGSGKSMTMLCLAVKLKRVFENPLLVVVTDRIDLDDQISGTFVASGFSNPIQVESGKDLTAQLKTGGGQTILTTIQKFEAIDTNSPAVNASDRIFVLVDEAHRTQYNKMAARMRKALPNACFLGFTGTPIEKKDRHTLQTFGPYIHTYNIEEAVRDEATVSIFYESRLPELRVEGESLDKLFERVFRELKPEQREQLKKKYASQGAIAEAPQRIRRICMDLLEHFEKFIRPNGFKAQIVTNSREMALIYKKTLDELGGPPSALIFAVQKKDRREYHDLSVPKDKLKGVIKDFKRKEHPLCILIVCDMLTTGFDAPVEQVMYLDSGPKEHTLLQTIARVNRKAAGKDYGLIVDYWGVSEYLQDALSIFSAEDVAGALRPKRDELPRLAARNRAAMRFFDRIDRVDMEGALRIIEPEDVRADFELAFRRFSQSLDMVLPDPEGLAYIKDLKWLGALRLAAKVRFRQAGDDLSMFGAKVRLLIDEHVRSDGVQVLMEPVDIFSKGFDRHVKALGSDEARASEMEHAIRHEIHVHFDEDPVFFRSLRQRLEELIRQRKEERIHAAEQLTLLSCLVLEVRQRGKRADAYGLSESELAFYGLLTELHGDGLAVGESFLDEPRKALTRQILKSLEPKAVLDWTQKEDVQREMRREIKRLLRDANFEGDLEVATSRLMELTRVRLGRRQP